MNGCLEVVCYLFELDSDMSKDKDTNIDDEIPFTVKSNNRAVKTSDMAVNKYWLEAEGSRKGPSSRVIRVMTKK